MERKTECDCEREKKRNKERHFFLFVSLRTTRKGDVDDSLLLSGTFNFRCLPAIQKGNKRVGDNRKRGGERSTYRL